MVFAYPLLFERTLCSLPIARKEKNFTECKKAHILENLRHSKALLYVHRMSKKYFILKPTVIVKHK